MARAPLPHRLPVLLWLLLSFLAPSVGLGLDAAFEPRDWTNAEGKKVQASLLRIDGDSVHLQMVANGAKVKVKAATLSRDDRAFLDELVGKATALADRLAAGPAPRIRYDDLYLIAATGSQRALRDFKIDVTPSSFRMDAMKPQNAAIIGDDGLAVWMVLENPHYEFVSTSSGIAFRLKADRRSGNVTRAGPWWLQKPFSKGALFSMEATGNDVRFQEIGVQVYLTIEARLR